MQDVQVFLDYLALLLISTAFALFLLHLLSCWQRADLKDVRERFSQASDHFPGSGNLADPETEIPATVEAEVE